MTICEQQKLCQDAFLDITNYFASECPNMLTFYNMFKVVPVEQLQTIRINTQEVAVPILEYNPNWVEKCYISNKFFLIQVVYSEMLKFILHHTTKRAGGRNTALASSVITNCRESRTPLNFLPQDLRESTIALLETLPCRTWLDTRIAPDVVRDEDFILEKVEYILSQRENNPDQSTDTDSASANASDTDSASANASDTDSASDSTDNTAGSNTAGSNPSYEKLPSDTQPLCDYYSSNSQAENAEKWCDNPTMNESVTRTYENLPGNGWGTIGTGMLGKIKLANERKADVTSILARLRGKLISRKSETTRMKPNRRFPDDWRYMGNRHKYKSTVLFASDVSASMDLQDNLKAYSIFSNFLKESKLEYCSWDTVCSKPEEWTGTLACGDEITQIVSGGGTDPVSVGEMLEEEDKHYDCVILFTDCDWYWQTRNIPLETQLVVISCDNDYPLSNLPDFVDFSLTLKDLINE